MCIRSSCDITKWKSKSEIRNYIYKLYEHKWLKAGVKISKAVLKKKKKKEIKYKAI